MPVVALHSRSFLGYAKSSILSICPKTNHFVNSHRNKSIVIYGRDGKLLESKGLLFQAKKTNNRDSTIFDQIENMENAVGRNGSALFFYDKQKGFTATDASEFEGYSKKGKEFKLNELIATEFMECRIGVKGVRYDLKSKKLIRPGPDLLNVAPIDLRNRAEIVVERK